MNFAQTNHKHCFQKQVDNFCMPVQNEYLQ